MPKRIGNLFEQITSLENLQEAYKKTSKNKLQSYGYLEFREYSELNLKIIQDELIKENYEIGKYKHFYVYEPKERLISSLSFKDRLVQHALCNVVEPIMDSTLLPYTFACRKNFGTHAGIKHIQSLLRKYQFTHFLKLDFRKFFASIPRHVIHEIYSRKIKCSKTLNLISKIIPLEGTGIPIGSLTSQITANLVGSIVDYYIHFELKCKYWARYMDDIVILGNDPQNLRNIFYQIQNFIKEKLNIDISKWSVSSTSKGINFLGFRIWHDYKLLRRTSVIAAKRKIKTFILHNDNEELHKFLVSWLGHAQWSNSYNIVNYINKNIINTHVS